MNELYEWAIRHGVGMAAMHELQCIMGVTRDEGQPTTEEAGLSEAAIQNNVRLEASHKGMRLFRNNVGGDKNSGLRWGLANDSSAVNKVIASSDLIGIDSALITLADVGQPRGRFLSIEVKEAGWNYTGAGRETPQFNWIKLINSLGGRAMFVNRTGML